MSPRGELPVDVSLYKNHQEEINITCEIKEEDISKLSMESELIQLWRSQNDFSSETVIKMEEFRTIIGYTVNVTLNSEGEKLYTVTDAINVDDLCENLYRLYVGQPLRYGHVIISASRIIEKFLINRMEKFYDETIKKASYKIKKS